MTNVSDRLNIIRATADEVGAVAPLFDAYRQFYGQLTDLEGAIRFLVERLEQGQSVIFLAERDGSACGFTQLYPAFSSVAMSLIWILNDLFVTPEVRRKSVGKRLVDKATEFAIESGAKRLVLATATENRPAQSLYEALGWVKDEAFLHYHREL